MSVPLLADPTRLISLVGGLFKNIAIVVHKIVEKINQVNANKRQCHTFGQRIQRVLAHLHVEEFVKKVQSQGNGLLKTLKAFHAFLYDCLQFIESFVDTMWITKFFHSTSHSAKFEFYNKELQHYFGELNMGLNIHNSTDCQQEKLEDLDKTLSRISDQQYTMMYLQQALSQHQRNQIDQWGQVLLKHIEQLKTDNVTTKYGNERPSQMDTNIASSIPSVVPSHPIFPNGSWLNRYFQYGVWHGPFKHWMIFHSNTNTFEGHGVDNVGEFILSGFFSKETNQIDLIQSYKYGTGNPLLNIGHQCRSRMAWNQKRSLFEGVIYAPAPYGSMLIPDGLFEMAFVHTN